MNRTQQPSPSNYGGGGYENPGVFNYYD